ncbi:MAG: hypothetical protein WD850_03420 [Candidatus Spechtbacterales bacterium]
MKTIIVTSVLAVLFVMSGTFAAAHGPVTLSEAGSHDMMMRYMEERLMDEDVHEEMEVLMERMWEGELSEAEADRLVDLMQQNPTPSSMMMNRFGMSGDVQGWGHMGWDGGAFGWFIALTWLVWLGVGIAALVFILQRIVINNKKQ